MKTKLIAALLVCATGLHLQAASILLVSDNAYADSRTGDPEAAFESWLQGLGYDVIRATGSGSTAQFRENNGGAAAAAAIGADLVIVSRVTSSGSYDLASEVSLWNGITSPLILMGPHLARSSHWKWFDSTTVQSTTADADFVTDLAFPDSNHPLVAGLGTSLYDAPGSSLSRLDVTTAGNGTVVATAPDGDVAIAAWAAGTEFYPGAGQIAGGDRVFFGGLRYHESSGVRQFVFDDYSENGLALLAQTIAVTIPEPGTWALMIMGGLGLLAVRLRRR